MADNEDVFTSKILLKYAASRSKAKSWLVASLGPEEEQDAENAASSTHRTNENFTLTQGEDENAGVGVVKKAGESDNLSDRQLLSVNEALRKRLLSRDAYKNYKQGSKNELIASKPMPSKLRRKVEDEDSEEEGKGRSGRVNGVVQEAVPYEHENAEGAENTPLTRSSTKKPPSKGKKRPVSYLDQVLAEREEKSRKKMKANAGSG